MKRQHRNVSASAVLKIGRLRQLPYYSTRQFGRRTRSLPKEVRKGRLVKRKGNKPAFALRVELFRITGTDLTQVDGIDVVTATTILSEAGWDMNPWKDEDHFVSWLRLCPDNRISGNKVLGKVGCPPTIGPVLP